MKKTISLLLALCCLLAMLTGCGSSKKTMEPRAFVDDVLANANFTDSLSQLDDAVIPQYYGVDSATVSSIARYIFQFMSMKPDSADVVVRAAFCHHFEDYASLMEYYAPSAHGMEGYTRG